MKSTLFIPKKLKIGFQTRSGTFTGKLAYVIYYDEKGKLRKEQSWEGWRDKSIEPIELDNTALTGFVLNKGIQRHNYDHWGSGRSVIRVHHPEGFEFEISVDNLVGILMHSDVSKRDILEKCVFAWSGTDLVLLPVNSEAYEQSVAYTNKQGAKVSAKSLVLGRRYSLKKSASILTYIGYYECFEFDKVYGEPQRLSVSYPYRSFSPSTQLQHARGKKHVFHDGSRFVTPSMSALSGEVADDIADNFAELVDEFLSNPMSQPIVGLHVDPVSPEPFTCDYNNKLKLSKVEKDALITIAPGDEVWFYHSSQERIFQGYLALRRQSYFVAFADGYKRSATSPADVLNLPYDPEGQSDTALHPTDIVLAKPGQTHIISCTLSARYMQRLHDEGFGILYYVLKNGKHYKVNS